MIQLESLIPCARMVEWRRQKQDRYPEDAVNSRAVALLTALQAEVSTLNGSPVHQRLVNLWEAEERCCGERDVFSVIVAEGLRAVGFSSFPTGAKELLEEIANRLEVMGFDPFSGERNLNSTVAATARRPPKYVRQ